MNVSMTLKPASRKQWVKQAETALPSTPEGLRVINQQLWSCCKDAGIAVFDSELQQQRTIPAADMGDVYDVTEMSNGDVIIAAANGLYHSSKGKLYSMSLFFSKMHLSYARNGIKN